METSRLTRDGAAEPVSRDQILKHERGQGNIIFSCSADHVQDWQPYPVDPYSCYMCDHTYCVSVRLCLNTLLTEPVAADDVYDESLRLVYTLDLHDPIVLHQYACSLLSSCAILRIYMP